MGRFIWLMLFLSAFLAHRVDNHNHQNRLEDKHIEIDKSFELFKYSNLLKQRTWFKLKCEFTIAGGASSSSSFNDSTTTNSSSNNPNAYFKIRWFKLNDRKNFTLLHEFNAIRSKEETPAANADFSNVFVNDLDDTSENKPTTAAIAPTAKSNYNLNKLKSNLIFMFKNLNDLNKANGLYLCKLDRSSNGMPNNNTTQINHLQSVQKITINEMINQNEMLFKLNYTLIQTTSSRFIFEIKPLKTFNQQINSNSRLIYSLSHLASNTPIVRGSIDMSHHSSGAGTNSAHHSKKYYLVVEALQANTSYVLLIYLKTNLNTDANYVQLVANRTLSTQPRPFQSPTKSRLSENESTDEDETEDEYELDEYDDYLDVISQDEDPSKRVVSCDLLKKSASERSNSAKTPLFGSQSLFADSKSNKPKSNLITINYSDMNFQKLVHTTLNSTASTLVDLQDFKDVFTLNKFNKELFDYSVLHDCWKQLQQTGFKESEPMCLFNLESQSLQYDFANSDAEYDYYDTASVLSDDHFSVQTSFEHDDRLKMTHFYLASACQKRKRPIRNSNQFGSLLSKETASAASVLGGQSPPAKAKYLVRLNETRPNFVDKSDTITAASPPPNDLFTTPRGPHHHLNQAELLQAIKKQHIAQMTNINECQMLNENEIQFQIESKLTESMGQAHKTSINRISSNNGPPNFFNYTPYFYHIEILVPDVVQKSTTANKKQLNYVKPKFRALAMSQQASNEYPVWLKFKFKIEGSPKIQVVRVNLTNSSGNRAKSQNANKFNKEDLVDELEFDTGSAFNDDDELEEEEYLLETNRARKFNGEVVLTTLSPPQPQTTTPKLKYQITVNDTPTTTTTTTKTPQTTTTTTTSNNYSTTKIAITNSTPTLYLTTATSGGGSGSSSGKSKYGGVVLLSSTSSKLLSTFAEPLFALESPITDYVFKIKILTEDNIQLSEFELNVSCKKMSSTNGIGNGLNEGNNSFVGLIMTCICAIVIIIVGSIFCLFIKRKYGLSPEYFLNLKNNILFRSPNNNRNQTSAHNSHMGSNLAKRSKNISNYQHQVQQYQLETKPHANLLGNINANNIQQSNTCNLKNPTFNYNYVRILKQKWHSTSNNRRHFYLPYSKSYSISHSSSLNNVKPRQSLLKRIRAYLLNNTNADPMTNSPVKYTSVSRSGSSSASSSPLVLFSNKSVAAAATVTPETLPKKNNNNNNDGKIQGGVEVATNVVDNCGSNSGFSYYSTSFTNSIRSKLTSLRNNFCAYKEDHDSIGLDLFESYVQKMHVDGDFGFAQLYEEITALTKSYSYSSDVALLECNRCKNRYSNILTYDHSRVKLACDERDESAGYINANYVDGYQKQNAYIATQGPMPNTFGDFWRMIWEKNCSIIVMITNVKEKGRIKCDQYWPEDGVECYSNIQVTHLHTITVAFYTKRIFTIKLKSSKKRCNSERLVYQFHFTDWPDHGVPYYIMPVLSFIKKSSRSNPEFGGPIVVHCSAGVGRTGTYIVIDAMMKQIQTKATVNIHTFLKHIRHQRNYLVQTEEQFIFIYDALLEAIKSGETELNEHNYKSYLDGLVVSMCGSGFGGSGSIVGGVGEEEMLIDRQFELICEFKPNEYQVSIALLPFNFDKNRNTKIIPVNNSRVVLSKNPAIDGSEYINATYLHGCNRQDEFIITQYPLETTRSAFWQMVWDNNSSQIVCLQSEETESCEPYWLPLGECMKCGDSFTVQLREENFDMDFVLRDFLLQSIDEDYEFNCRMITACYWPDSCTPIKTAFDLVNKVKMFRLQSQQVQGQNNSNCSSSNGNNPMMAALGCGVSMANLPPLIVHDLCGSFRAATFCALYTFQDLVHLESSVNVYETAKMFYLKRPGLWTHKSNIMFLYEAVEYLFDEMHSNNHYQFRNYLNLNIDNHFHNLLYSSNHYYNQNIIQSQQQQQQHISSNHISLTLLPTIQSQQPSQQSKNSNTSTLTLPNNLTQMSNNASTKFNLPIIQQQQQQQMRINEAIGTRLHNFQDPMTTVPLTSAKISMDPQQQQQQQPSQNKSSFIDISRSIMPSFFEPKTHQQARRSTSANYRNNKAIKFMNTMRMKSVSFKRALFPSSSMPVPPVPPQPQPQQTQPQHHQQQKPSSQPKLISQPMQLQTQPVKLEPNEAQIDCVEKMPELKTGLQDVEEQKPSIIISLSSGSSSATTSSSSTALSSMPMTATESMSYKSAFVTSQLNNLSNTQTQQQQQQSKSLSREKLTLA